LFPTRETKAHSMVLLCGGLLPYISYMDICAVIRVWFGNGQAVKSGVGFRERKFFCIV